MSIEIRHIGKEKSLFPCVAYKCGSSGDSKITVLFTSYTTGIVVEVIGEEWERHLYEYVPNLVPLKDWIIIDHARIVIKT